MAFIASVVLWNKKANSYLVISYFGPSSQELPYLGGVLDDSSGPGIWNGWLAGSGPDPSGEEWRCVRNIVNLVKLSFLLFWSFLIISHYLKLTFFPFFLHLRRLLLWPSSSQSNQRSAYWPALWRPLCLCWGERCRPHDYSEPGSGAQCQQRHRESWIPHLHQSYWLPQSPQHYRRLQMHQKYETKIKNTLLFCSLAKEVACCSLQVITIWFAHIVLLYNVGPSSTLKSRSSTISEDSTLRRGNTGFWNSTTIIRLITSLNTCHLIHWLPYLFSRTIWGGAGLPEPG